MVTRITVGFIGADFATLSAAIASIPPGALSEPHTIEVHADTPTEAITVPSTIIPSSANPLRLFALRGPTVASPFSDVRIDTGHEPDAPAPQPRLQRPVMSSVDVQSVHTKLDGFRIDGDVTISANDGVDIRGNLLVDGRIIADRVASTMVDAIVANNEIRLGSAESQIFFRNVTGIKAYHNTVLVRREDAADINKQQYAIEVIDSEVEAKNNIFASRGGAAFAIKFIGDPANSTFNNNLYFAFDGSEKFFFGPDTSTITETDVPELWQNFMASETNILFSDPEFFDATDATAVDLDISNTSPAMAAAPAISGIDTDVRSERRPVDLVTIGAHEHSEVITDSGKVRFLEILAGISTDPVTKTVLGDSGGTSIFEEYPAQLADDSEIDNPLFSPIAIEGIHSAGDGKVIFRPSFQVTLPIYGELIDSTFDRADEVGLLGADNEVFMIKRMRSIPFDATGFLHTQFTIPVQILGSA